MEVVEEPLELDAFEVVQPTNSTPLAPLEEVCPLDLPIVISVGPSSDPSLPSSIDNVKHTQPSPAKDDAVVSLEIQDAENGPQDEDDEWEAYWKDDDLLGDIYTQVNLDAGSSDPSGL